MGIKNYLSSKSCGSCGGACALYKKYMQPEQVIAPTSKCVNESGLTLYVSKRVHYFAKKIKNKICSKKNNS